MINGFTPLYLLAIYGAVRFFFKAKKDATDDEVNWSPLESVAVTLALYFGVQVVGGILVYLIPLIRGMNQKEAIDWLGDNVYGQFIFVAVVEALTVLALYWFLKRRKGNLRTIGLKGKPRIMDMGYVLLAFIAYFILFAILVSVIKHVAPSLNIDQKQDIGFKSPERLQLPFVFVSLVLLPPIAEELMVRGFLYTGLKKGMRRIFAVLIASGLFAIAHLQAGQGQPLLWIAAIDTFTLSLMLIYLREKTGSLWASIMLHMLKNGIAFMSLYIFHLG
jgi:membrane protease YdiL (CAAX protease family)